MAFDRNAEADQAYGHKPVLLDECLEALAIRPDGVYLDGTLGRAGHSLEILRRLTAGGRLIGLDRDGTALEAARVRLAEYADRVTLVHSNFSRLAEVLDDLHIDAVDGMLFDLGVSSPQLDDAERGFSYMHDAPLDMRMDRTAGLTARDVVNGWSYEELRRILFEYGEERYAPAIARHIVERREKAPIETTGQLVEVIRSAMPPAALREKQHPAKRSFQAIRIAVNGELEELPPMLRAAAQRLHPGGRLAVISFHSLEDRIIKKTMQELATGCTCPPNFPVCVCGKKPQMKLVSRKPIVATEAELTYNPRARSAKLRGGGEAINERTGACPPTRGYGKELPSWHNRGDDPTQWYMGIWPTIWIHWPASGSWRRQPARSGSPSPSRRPATGRRPVPGSGCPPWPCVPWVRWQPWRWCWSWATSS